MSSITMHNHLSLKAVCNSVGIHNSTSHNDRQCTIQCTCICICMITFRTVDDPSNGHGHVFFSLIGISK
jgi:hypothetical protein